VAARLCWQRSRRTGQGRSTSRFFCIAGSLFSLPAGPGEGSSWGWTSYPVLILFGAAINLLALFVVVELQIKHPLLNIRIFATGRS